MPEMRARCTGGTRRRYLIDGTATLIHSHRAEWIPAEFNKDMCAISAVSRRYLGGISAVSRLYLRCSFINSYTGPRIVFRDKDSEYRLIKSAKECRERLKKYEPSYCDDRGLAYAATWPDAKNITSWPFKPEAPNNPTLVGKPFEASMKSFKRAFKARAATLKGRRIKLLLGTRGAKSAKGRRKWPGTAK